MNELLPDMYDTSDYQTEKENQPTVSIKSMHQVLREVEINGTKFYSVDPVEFTKMESQLKYLKQRVEVTEQRIKILYGALRDKDIVINQLRRELDNKISYS